MCLVARDTTFSINNIELSSTIKNQNFSFLIAGHAYGSQSQSVYPCQSLTQNIEKINSDSSEFMILLGDNFRIADSINIALFKSSFLNKLNIPVFNALGNHDVNMRYKDEFKQNYENYHKHFSSKTYYQFSINSSLFIILDTEMSEKDGRSNGTISGSQLAFLQKTIRTFQNSENNTRKNLFIFGHKEINLFKDNNFHADIYPTLFQAAETGINIYLFSGDMGRKSNQVYFLQDKHPNIKFMHTHLADNKEDAILKVSVSSNGIVQIKPISLYNLPMSNIEDYKKLNQVIPQIRPSFLSKIAYRFLNRHFYEGIIFILLLLLVYKSAVYLRSKNR